MATFILTCFLILVLAVVAKLIYDVQQSKKSIKIQQNEITADEVDAFQKLAGIKPINPNDELRQILVKNNLNTEKLTEELKKEFENSEFPAPDPSIPVITAKITTIDLNSKEDKDPLGSVPMSRVSNEAKEKMAEIAKQDISNQLEKNAENYAAISGQKVCGCGRSETGFCTGLHRIPKADWENGIREIIELPKIKAVPSENDQRLGMEFVKPVKKRNPKQSIKGTESAEPFVKTRKKATKKPKA